MVLYIENQALLYSHYRKTWSKIIFHILMFQKPKCNWSRWFVNSSVQKAKKISLKLTNFRSLEGRRHAPAPSICLSAPLPSSGYKYIVSGTSLYFTLISFTTIGFGDIVPDERGFILFAFLLFIGLALVSTVLNLIQQQIEALATVSQSPRPSKVQNVFIQMPSLSF